MEEVVLIKSKKYAVKKFFVIMLLIGLLLSFFIYLAAMPYYNNRYDEAYDSYIEHKKQGYCRISDEWTIYGYEKFYNCEDCEDIELLSNKFTYSMYKVQMNEFDKWLVPIIVFSSIGLLVVFLFSGYELTVTNKKVFGKIFYWKRIDLPLDSVSSTSTTALFKGISVSTPSGKLKFLFIKNRKEIYETISALLIDRQTKEVPPFIPQNAPIIDESEQLIKYKDLLDKGIITQEEFDTKKKQLLNL